MRCCFANHRKLQKIVRQSVAQKTPDDEENNWFHVAPAWSGPLLEPGLWVGHADERLVAGPLPLDTFPV